MTEITITSEGSTSAVELDTTTIEVDVITPPAIVVTIEQEGRQGPKGDAGTAGSSTIIELTAGETISGGKAVIVKNDGKVYVYDITDESHYGRSVGIAKTSALLNESLEIYTGSVAHEVGSGWLVGRLYYVAANGTLTTTIPTTGITKLVGVGIEADKVLINNVLEIISI